ncbi:MAG: pimeloyl-ACP methyl ester carboxylesterase [Candidatus Azotimanducaceae bacterium]|jgi:pimeloyl-ACP methyl ester carboxylesterase
MSTIFLIAILLMAFHLFRQHITNKTITPIDPEKFQGQLYEVGETVFAIREAEGGEDKTIVCFPGFTETMSYFTELYKDEKCQLILVNNALYHSPFDLSRSEKLNWAANPYQAATIQYDGFYLAKIIKDYATFNNIFVHGHSRGGAVVLDAGRQFPEITLAQGKSITAILEAAVVPKGTGVVPKPGKIGQAITQYLMPVMFNVYANISRGKLEKMPMMEPTNDLKTNMVMKNFKSPKHYWVYLINVSNIPEWQEEQPHSLYETYRQVVLIQGQRDDVLQNQTMEASAQIGQTLNKNLRIVKTMGTNHFISLEKPCEILDIFRSQKPA